MTYYDLTYIDQSEQEQTVTLSYETVTNPVAFVDDLNTQLGYDTTITNVVVREE